MYLQTLPRSIPRRAARQRWLICLDLQRDHVIPGRPSYAPANADVALACARVLDLARDEGWRIVHSQFRVEPTDLPARARFGAPIEALRPLISEPVFFRGGLSAFANPAFATELARARGGEVFLIGFSLADTCLATALAAVDAGLSLTLLEDAVGASDAVDAGDVVRTILRPFVRVLSSRRLEAQGLEAVP
jgi:nicotinamidase-related amidase